MKAIHFIDANNHDFAIIGPHIIKICEDNLVFVTVLDYKTIEGGSDITFQTDFSADDYLRMLQKAPTVEAFLFNDGYDDFGLVGAHIVKGYKGRNVSVLIPERERLNLSVLTARIELPELSFAEYAAQLAKAPIVDVRPIQRANASRKKNPAPV